MAVGGWPAPISAGRSSVESRAAYRLTRVKKCSRLMRRRLLVDLPGIGDDPIQSLLLGREAIDAEIGRASCRERV